MASKELTIRVRADFGGDGTKLGKVLEEIQSETEELTGDLMHMGPVGSKAFETIGLGANTQLSSLQRFNSEIQGFTGRIGAGINKIDEFGKSLGPWNQTLELAGKAVRFAQEGLDAYAKTSDAAAKDVKKLTDEFTHYRDTVMQSVGQLTVELLKPAVSFDEQYKALLKIENNKAFQIMFGDKGVTSGGLGGLRLDDLTPEEIAMARRWGVVINESGRAQRAVLSLRDTLGDFRDTAVKALHDASDPWNTEGRTIIEGLLNVEKATDKAAKGTNKAAIEAARYRAELAALSSRTAKSLTDDLLARLAREANSGAHAQTPDAFASHYSALSGGFARMNEQLRGGTVDQRYGAFQAKQQQSFLEQHFGKLDDFDAYATAFGTLTDATQSAMSAWISGSLSLGLAIKKGIGDALGALASQLAVEAIKHGAYALGSLAFGDFTGAARHGAAAVAFGAGSAAAAVAARQLGKSVQAATAEPASASSAGATPQPTGGAGGGGGTGGQGQDKYIIVYSEAFYAESARMQGLDANSLVRRATGTSYVENS